MTFDISACSLLKVITFTFGEVPGLTSVLDWINWETEYEVEICLQEISWGALSGQHL